MKGNEYLYKSARSSMDINRSSTSFKYSLNPVSDPLDRTFLDRFLPSIAVRGQYHHL